MQIENRDRLKTHLIRQLGSLTEADPDVLSDYVIALLENSSAGSELEASMVNKLEDFLASNTSKFVSDLLKYIAAPAPAASAVSSPIDESTEDRMRKRSPPPMEEGEAPSHQERRVRNVCNDWKKGRCMRGSRCRFAHPQSEFTPVMPVPPLPFAPHPFQQSQHKIMQQPFQKRANFGVRPQTVNSNRLIVDKIPLESCTITAIHDHFAKFGTIVNIDLMPEQGRAKLQYSDHEGAQAAFSSPDVIFNNRFVTVSWEIDDSPPLMARNSPMMTHNHMGRPVLVPPQPQPAPLDPQQELLKKRKETLEAFVELQKQKEALLQKYLAQQKSLLEALNGVEEGDEAGRGKLLEELRMVEEAIKTVAPQEKPAASPGSQPILKGGPVQRGRGRGSYHLQPVPRQVSPASFKLDLRPKTLKMTPIPPKLGTDPGSIRKFFEAYGQVANLAVHDESAVVTFINRTDAEKAMFYLGKSEEGVLLTWENTSAPAGSSVPLPSE